MPIDGKRVGGGVCVCVWEKEWAIKIQKVTIMRVDGLCMYPSPFHHIENKIG